jgi:hypothetical protein
MLPAHENTHVEGHPTRLLSTVWRIYTGTEEAHKFASVCKPARRRRRVRSVSQGTRNHGNTGQALGSTR